MSDGSNRPDAGKWQSGWASVPPGDPGRPAVPQDQQPTALNPAVGGTGAYGKASVPLNTARPASPAPSGASSATPSGASGGADPGPLPADKSRFFGTKVVAAAATVVVLVALAVVGLVVRPGPIDGWLSAESPAPTRPAITPDPKPTPVLAAVAAQGEPPSAPAVKAALDPLVGSAALGDRVHASVVDVASQELLYSRDAEVPTTPASTTKLLTAVTALAARGPAYRLATRAVAGGRPGEVVIIGGGDPTLAINAKAQFPGAARLDRLAAQVRKAMGGTPITRVTVDISLFSGPETAKGWDSEDISPLGQVSRIQALMTNAGRITPVHNEHGGDPRFSDPALAAGRAFANLLDVPSERVGKGKAPAAAAASAPASAAASAPAAGLTPGRELGRVESPPLVQILDWMLQQSDNTLAEAIGRQVPLAAGAEASFDGTAEAMIQKLRDLGLNGDEADLYDASGLSRNNGISPALLVQTLSLAANGTRPELSAMFDGLPVAGWSGTLRTRFVTPSPNRTAQGVVRAKTGTLSGVNTLAGVLVTKDGRVLAFALMASATSDAGAAKSALDKVVAKLVACGCA
ncbi:D-alanyl-D-alanine carboxypeptidase/D-alanyl-D-alanine-endopeptidase (penicillin-binding protein 4) [Actinoplanes octamycinicus]|uniref:D-alanyl-D-alanine carboxypeptidase/D-alanyl-D-alanine-endopeptidase (Penicillin-binding protein 4) n=1 Tax=Actinoplanes octamycinicus TaxID=135948 RepID=A0A7W7GT81_9ACTN|nr:D-alanyl-D-alanine carboxypeptidase/D-alanyl-D-alanine-endopeptidase [Actinoplanes octamycinicus]MBB4737828.1 D-alanyl-D-alanine carboxypeptidase/D-alanyl-D-alanine-endopeptidase (penicillin-binding protein 4) [Actinoplanes octamycinicus]